MRMEKLVFVVSLTACGFDYNLQERELFRHFKREAEKATEAIFNNITTKSQQK